MKKCAAILGVLAFTFSLRSAEAPAPVFRTIGLSHVAVKASNYERSIAFYRDFLGFAEEGRLFRLNTGLPELTFFKINDTQTIEVFEAANISNPGFQLYQVALQVDNAEGMRALLAGQGFRTPQAVALGQMKNANFTTRDLAGYILEVVQYLPEGKMILDRGKFMPSTRISGHLIAATIVAPKLDETLRFYRETLGFGQSARTPSAPRAACFDLSIPGSRDYIEVVAGSRNDTESFRLEVDDLERAIEVLKQRAAVVNYSRPLVLAVTANGQRMVPVFDPDGLRIELVEAGQGGLAGMRGPSSSIP